MRMAACGVAGHAFFSSPSLLWDGVGVCVIYICVGGEGEGDG